MLGLDTALEALVLLAWVPLLMLCLMIVVFDAGVSLR